MIVWKWNGLYNADAEKVAKEIEDIENATAESILNYARDSKTELHKCFEWDDNIAAENWRKHQARLIVCNLVYKDTEKEMPSKLRVFHVSESGNDYKPTRVLVQNKSEYESLLERAYRELQAFKDKYKMLNELDEIFQLIK